VKPLVVDLYSGLHGWCEGFVAEGYCCVAFDIADMCKLVGARRPKNVRLILRDVTKLNGAELVAEFGVPVVFVASPPCQEYSYMAMPWSLAKERMRKYQSGELNLEDLTLLFDTCFRIQREACEAAGRYIPLIVENVRGAQKWVGRARWHFGSYFLWGDVPALMPTTFSAFKSSGMNWSDQTKHGQDFTRIAGRQAAIKNDGGSWFAVAHNTESGHSKNPVNRTKGTGGSWFTPDQTDRVQGHWRESGCVARCYNSKDARRKAASAAIAKIPFPLAQYIARVFKPAEEQAA